MLRSTLKRNLLPIALIALGGLIFLAIILYLFRSYLATVGWVLFGLLLIGVGALGIVAANPKNRTPAAGKPSGSSPAAPGASPKYAARAGEIKSAQQIAVSRPALIGGGVLLASLVLLLLCNVGIALRSLLTVHRTQIVDCREASRYAEEGWHFVSVYSYGFDDAVSGYTERTDCVMEQERFVWARDKRIPKDNASEDDASMDDASMDDASMDDASMDDASEDATFEGDDLATLAPRPDARTTPTQFPAPTATPMALPTSTPWPGSAPPSTETPPSIAGEPTATPVPPSPTPTPIPRTDVEVCAAAIDDAYLDVYVQWEGIIIDDPTFEDEGLWFQVQWTNVDTASDCSEAVFFVSYDSDERFFAEDMVVVTGTITEIAYEYEGESGETAYTVVIRADYVEFLDEP